MAEQFDWADDEAMADLPLRGIEPYEIRQALEYEGPRLRRDLGADVFGVYSRTWAGRYLVVFIVETTDPRRWLIYGGREMLPGEIADYEKRLEGNHE
jgi:hypothetical protein